MHGGFLGKSMEQEAIDLLVRLRRRKYGYYLGFKDKMKERCGTKFFFQKPKKSDFFL